MKLSYVLSQVFIFTLIHMISFGEGPTWPVLKHYNEHHLDKIALPVGGIGTGTVSLGGRGNLQDWEIMNRPAKGYNPGPEILISSGSKRKNVMIHVMHGTLQLNRMILNGYGEKSFRMKTIAGHASLDITVKPNDQDAGKPVFSFLNKDGPS